MSGRTQTICFVRFGYLSEDPRLQKQVGAALDDGWNVHVVCLAEAERRSSLESHERLTVHRLGLTRWRAGKATYAFQYLRFLTGALARVVSIGRREQLDVVQANNVPNVLTVAGLPARRRGTRIVLDMQEPMPELFSDRFGGTPTGTVARVLRHEERLGARLADRVITVSEVVRELVEPRCGTRRPIVVIENTPDERFFEWAGEPLERSPFVVSCHSSLLPRYGVDVLVEAFASLRHLPDVRLEIYGEGDEREALEGLTRRLGLDGVVTFKGQYPLFELARALREVHVGVVPLVQTPFTELMSPNKLFEYVALGKPVIASALRGMRATFDDTEVRFVAPGDPAAIAGAIEDLYRDPALGRELARRAADRLDAVRWSLARERYLSVLVGVTPEVRRIEGYSRPLVAFHDTYQRYYVTSLQSALASSGGRFDLRPLGRAPRTLTRLRALEDRGLVTRVVGKRGAEIVWQAAGRLEGPIRSPANTFHNTVGQYIAHAGGDPIRFCVDSADSPSVSSEPLLDWADLYFKTNRWFTESYPASVRPLVNGDPLVLPELGAFRAARSRAKTIDLSFVVRVWGGRDTLEGVEHNLRLLEALNRVPGETLVLAVVQAGDTEAIERRLEGMGIRSTRRAVDAAQLWDITARSRLTVMRLGLHWCIPWRATGLFASGAAPIFDRAPFSEWPVPLRPGENFLDLGLDVGPAAPTAEESAYREVASRVTEWLADEQLPVRMATTNAEYFDRHVAPLPVGRYMLETLLRRGP